jgi:zinc protease
MARRSLHRATLPNGLELAVRVDRTAPVVCSLLACRVGSRDEEEGKSGRSHFLEHMLFKGTARLPKGEIDRRTAIAGGQNNAFTTHDFTAYWFLFASDRWETALEIDADRLMGTRFEPAEFEAEKAVVLEELRMLGDAPWSTLVEQAEATLWREHVYRRPVGGTVADLEATSADEMEGFYRRFYRPDNAILVLTGDLDAGEAEEKVRRAFGSLAPPSSPLARRSVPAEPEPTGERRIVLERGTALSRLVVGVPAVRWGDPSEPAARVLSAILGDGRGSRLHRRLVERDRLAGEVGEELDARLDPGPLLLFVEAAEGVDPARVEKALFEEVESVALHGPDRRALARAKARIVASELLDRSSPLGEAEELGEELIRGGVADGEARRRRIEAVSSREVKEVAGRLFAPRRRTIAWALAPRRSRGFVSLPNLPPSAAPRPPRSAPKGVPSVPTAVTISRPVRIELPVRRVVLDNGIVALLNRSPGGETASVDVELAGGMRDEPRGCAGLALLAARMLGEGTSRFDAERIAGEIESRGASLEIDTFFDRSRLRLEGLSRDLDDLLGIGAALLRDSLFPSDRLALRKELQIDEIRSDADNPAFVASEALSKLVYGEHPLGRPVPGTERSVRGIDRRRVLAFARSRFRPAGIRIGVSSGRPVAEVERTIRKLLGRWKGEPLPPSPVPSLRLAERPRFRRIVERREQVHLFVGHLGIRRLDPRFAAAQLLDIVLGAGPGFFSRIPHRLRDTLGLAYSTSADLTASSGLEPGRFAAYAATAPENEEKALAALIGEIRRFRREGPTPLEVEEAKAHLIGRAAFDVESGGRRVETMLALERYGLGLDYLSRYPLEIGAATREQVLAAARELLHPDRLATVILGPRKGSASGAD